MALRWRECDHENDPIRRLDCRTSKLNDGFHRLESDLQRLNRKVNAGLIMQGLAGAGGVAALLNALHNLGIIH